MTTANELASNDVPGIQIPRIKHFANLWQLYYRHGMNPLLSKVFYLEGTLQDAMARGRKHCQLMNYKYHFTRPLVFDLEEEEAYRAKGGLEVQEG